MNFFCSSPRAIRIMARPLPGSRMKLPLASAIAAVIVVALTAPLALAQSQVERFNRQLDQIRRQTAAIPDDVPMASKAQLDYGAFASFNYFSIDDPSSRSHGLRQYVLFPYAQVNLDGANEFYIRGVIGYDDWNTGQSLTGRGDEPIDGDLDRGFYRFDLRNHQQIYNKRDIGFDLVAKGGRDLAYWANGLVLSQVLDGVFFTTGNDFLTLDLVAGVTPVRTVDIDSSRPAFDYNTRRGFYGAMLSAQVDRHRPFVYGLVQQDYNQDNVGLQSGITTVYDYNSWYIGTGVTGSLSDKLLYGVEVAYEGGSTLSNSFVTSPSGLVQVPQTEDDISAVAADIRLDYLLADPRDTRFTFETIIASGDNDRLLSTTNTFGGNAPNTTDRAFNAFGLLNTGLSFAPQVSNLLIFRAGAATFPLPDSGPFKRLQVGVDLFFYNKLVTDAPIEEETTDNRFLGWEPDLFINWQVTSDLTVAFRYGIFFPGSGIVDANDDPRQFISAGVTYAF